MAELDVMYPGYGFTSHAGYGVARHRMAIEELGVSPEHRLSFAPLQKYSPLPSSQISSKSARRSLDTGPVARSAPSSSATTASVGATPPRATRLATTTRGIGSASETAAANELVRLGHNILKRNWKTKYCEIDIVSKKGDTIYFTEVKHRKNDKAGDGLAAITPKKLRQMEFAVKLYVHTNHLTDTNLRLLAVSTTGQVPSVVAVVEF